MVEITKRQKKILMVAGIFLLGAAVFLIFIYFPAEDRMKKVKQEYLVVQAELDEFKKTIGADKPLEQQILSLRARLEYLNKKFPEKEEIIFQELSVLANNMEIDIFSMTPQKKQPVSEKGGAPLIKDCMVQEMPISMNLKTTYKKLGEFIKSLRENFPVFISIEGVTITRSGGNKESSVLNVTLSLDTYLISSKRAG